MDSFTGEIRVFAFNFAPQDWAMCNGGTMPLNQCQMLYAVIGTSYGGDGRTTVGLPDLQGKAPVGSPISSQVAQKSGTETETLDINKMANHSHIVNCKIGAYTLLTGSPAGNFPSRLMEPPPSAAGAANMDWAYSSTTAQPNIMLNTQSLAPAGGDSTTGATLPHENRQPYLAMNFCISLFGAFPIRPS